MTKDLVVGLVRETAEKDIKLHCLASAANCHSYNSVRPKLAMHLPLSSKILLNCSA